MNLRYLQHLLSSIFKSFILDGKNFSMINSLGSYSDGDEEIMKGIRTSDMSGIRKTNIVFSWWLRIVGLFALVFIGSMRINAYSGPVYQSMTYLSQDCNEGVVQSEMDYSLPESEVCNRQMEHPLFSLLQNKGIVEVIPEWCYIVRECIDGDVMQIYVNCNQEVCQNINLSKPENIEWNPLINRIWNMIFIGVDKEIRENILDYLNSGGHIQVNVDIVKINDFKDGILGVYYEMGKNFAFKVFPDKHLEKVGYVKELIHEVIMDDIEEDASIKEVVCE